VTSSARRLAARVALSIWVAGHVLPLAGTHARVLDDAACNFGVLATPHPVAQIEAVRPDVDDGHCPTCHLQRAIHGAVAPAPPPAPFAGGTIGRLLPHASGVRGEPRLGVSSRAPPVALL
jgi:hypothetical protein